MKILIILLVSPVIALSVHIAMSRIQLLLRSGISAQLVCILSVLAGNAPVLALVWYFSSGGAEARMPALAPTIIYTLMVYNALGYSYFHLFNMSETARRIRILYELNSKGSMEISAVSSYYETGDILKVRLERLVKMGQLKVEGRRYVLSGRLLLYSTRLIALWGRLIGSELAGR
jgi:hypothetical protein